MFLSWCCRVGDWWQEGFACFLSNYSQCNCWICLPPSVSLYPHPLPVSHSSLATFQIPCFLFPLGIANALECELGCLPYTPLTFRLLAPPVCVSMCVLLHKAPTVRPLQDFHRSPRQTSLKLLTWQTHISGLFRPCRPTVYLLTFGVAFESETSNQSSLFPIGREMSEVHIRAYKQLHVAFNKKSRKVLFQHRAHFWTFYNFYTCTLSEKGGLYLSPVVFVVLSMKHIVYLSQVFNWSQAICDLIIKIWP